MIKAAVMAFILCLPAWLVAGENLVEGGDAASEDTFVTRYNGHTSVSEQGKKHWQWSGNCWDLQSQGEIGLMTVNGEKAYYLRNLSGSPAIQFYNWKKIPLKAGDQYKLSISYRANSGNGKLIVEGDQVPKHEFELKPTAQWRTVAVMLNVTRDAGLSVMLQNLAAGSENTMYIRFIRLERTGDAQ